MIRLFRGGQAKGNQGDLETKGGGLNSVLQFNLKLLLERKPACCCFVTSFVTPHKRRAYSQAITDEREFHWLK